MKLVPLQNYRPVRFTMVASFGLLCGLLTIPCWAQQNIAQLPAAKTPAAKLPFDVFNEPIDGIQIYMHLENNANAQKQVQATDAVDILRQQLLAAKTSSDVSLDALTSHPLVNSDDLYPHMVKSCLYLGRFYNCGKCDRTHVAMACGVVIDESGLALTNYHVLSKRDELLTEGYMAMTYDGKCFEVEEILAADKTADVALVKLKANGHKFHAAPIAKTRPKPTAEVRMVSHPSGEFYVMTKGEVSRYSRTNAKSNPVTWLEITADFGAGSSGCGVFNSTGEVVGIASRIKPLSRAKSTTIRNDKKMVKPQYVELILRRCADLAAIKACFQPNEPASDPADAEADTAEYSPTP